MIDISFIIVNWNTKDLLLECLASVYQTVTDPPFEVWLVDNGSSDGSVETVRTAFPDVRVILNKVNMGFSAAVNQGIARMEGRYAVLLNTDATLTQGAVRTLYDYMETDPHVGIVCGQLLNPDGSRQNSIANFPSILPLITNEGLLQRLFPQRFPGKRCHYQSPVDVESCIGACMMVRKAAIDQVGLLDERYFFFLEETDWAYRMKQAGWGVRFVPSARIYHAQGKSVGRRGDGRILFYRSRYAYFRKWRPKAYPLIYVIIFIRLLVNSALALTGVGLTFGLKKDLRAKLGVYGQLIAWHLKGCP